MKSLKELLAPIASDFPNLQLGQEVELFFIDEHTDEECEPFAAVLEHVGETPKGPTVTFTAVVTLHLLERLQWCSSRDSCYLHFHITTRQGAFTASRDYGVLLRAELVERPTQADPRDPSRQITIHTTVVMA